MIIDSVLRLRSKDDTERTSDDQLKRSLAKTVSWRVIGTMDTIIISWIITGTLALAFSIGAVELVSKMGLYFFHERAWNTIKWGK